MIYENKISKKKVFVSDRMAAGMCDDTRGRTYVIYKYNIDDAYSNVMLNKNFIADYVKSKKQ